jgi:hypothetical protein
VGVHRRRSWHITSFPVIVAGLGVAALAVGLMFGGLHSDDAKPADAQIGQPTSTSVLPAPTTTTVAASSTADDRASSADTAVGGTASMRAPAAADRSTPHPSAGTAPRSSPSPAPSGDSGSDGGIQLPKVNLPTFG